MQLSVSLHSRSGALEHQTLVTISQQKSVPKVKASRQKVARRLSAAERADQATSNFQRQTLDWLAATRPAPACQLVCPPARPFRRARLTSLPSAATAAATALALASEGQCKKAASRAGGCAQEAHCAPATHHRGLSLPPTLGKGNHLHASPKNAIQIPPHERRTYGDGGGGASSATSAHPMCGRRPERAFESLITFVRPPPQARLALTTACAQMHVATLPPPRPPLFAAQA